MVLYPMVLNSVGLEPQAAGIFLGGTIHDIAQVVGAGDSVSQKVGDAATLVKLLRVAMLLSVIVVAAMITRARTGKAKNARPNLMPWFADVFSALVAGWRAEFHKAVRHFICG